MVFIFLAELVVLFLLSRVLTSELSHLFYRIFKSRKVSIWLMALIFLPGTIIHEFAHAIMAKALFVHVGKMELLPQVQGDSLKLGSVEVGKTDLVRNFFIGIAPFVAGVLLLLLILYYFFTYQELGLNLATLCLLIASFIISNTMYSSKKDMEGAIEFLLVIVAPILVLYILGVRIPVPRLDINSYFQSAAILLAIPLIVDLGIVVFAKIINKR